MAKSQNGWKANTPSLVSRRPVPGTAVGLTVRNGPAGDLLLEVACLFDRLVQDIDNGRAGLDDWGYAERPIRGAAALSNHASGTAIDLNATRWALGSSASVNLNATQIAKTNEIVSATGGVVRWGANYSGRKDPMHFEINDGMDEADCRRALDALRKKYGGDTADTDGDDELNAEEKKQLAQIHRAATLTLPLDGRPGARLDDQYGHVLSSRALLEQVLNKLGSIEQRLAKLES